MHGIVNEIYPEFLPPVVSAPPRPTEGKPGNHPQYAGVTSLENGKYRCGRSLNGSKSENICICGKIKLSLIPVTLKGKKERS